VFIGVGDGAGSWPEAEPGRWSRLLVTVAPRW
jgi:hypothetical protein